jgi:hypothetical protein
MGMSGGFFASGISPKTLANLVEFGLNGAEDVR